MTESERAFVERHRVARLATADARGEPHVVPVCFALTGDTLYMTIDGKPKRPGATLKRLANIADNPAVAVIVDHYDEDWSQLGWVMLRGRAEILIDGTRHHGAQAILRERYPQLYAMPIESCPVIAITIQRTTSWGKLDR